MPIYVMAIVLFFATLSPALAEARDFEILMPSELSTEITFWESVFTKYTPKQCVFHDKDDLSIVYAVVNISDDREESKKRIKKYSDAIQNGLLHLSNGGDPRSKLERGLVAHTPTDRRFPAYFRYAMNNFRCQRGVDLDASIARSKKYIGFVRKKLSDNGLPEDLAYLPHLESGYVVNAKSHAGARGIWQFIPGTARMWGLQVSRSRDDRINVWKSTEAASKFFADLYRKTTSWPLAVTAYNYGINGMMRAVNNYGADYLTIRKKHETAIFGFAAKNYFPSFLAARNVASSRDGSNRTIPIGSIAKSVEVKVAPSEQL